MGAPADFHGKTRRNDTHESITDPDARLYRKGPGQPAKLCFMGHALIENRHGLVVAAAASAAGGAAERNAALAMIEARADRAKRITLGADKGYDAQDFVNELRSMAVTPHVARKKRHSAIDKRTARHAGYATSQRRRKMVEEAFGWAKTIGIPGRPQTPVKGPQNRPPPLDGNSGRATPSLRSRPAAFSP